MIYFYQQNSQASFRFIGANTLLENIDNSKRFRVYRRVIENFFSTDHFQHYVYENKSAYLLLNNANKTPNLLANVIEMFEECYDFE